MAMAHSLATGEAHGASTREHLVRARLSEGQRAKCRAASTPSPHAAVATTVSPVGMGWGVLTVIRQSSARSDTRGTAGCGNGWESVAVDTGVVTS